jgi:hypothetical protein
MARVLTRRPPILGGDGLSQHAEVVEHQAEGGRVADLVVKQGRVPKVGEKDGKAAHGDVFPWAEYLAGE